MHERTDVVRTYRFTEAELRSRLGIGGQITAYVFSPADPILTIETEMIHPEDARFGAPPVPGEVCRICGAGAGQVCDTGANYDKTGEVEGRMDMKPICVVDVNTLTPEEKAKLEDHGWLVVEKKLGYGISFHERRPAA